MGLNRHFKPNMRKIQIAICSDLCITLTWRSTGEEMWKLIWRENVSIHVKPRAVWYNAAAKMRTFRYISRRQCSTGVPFTDRRTSPWTISPLWQLPLPFPLSLHFSQPSIYIDGWLYGMTMTSVTFRCCLKTIPHIIILSSRHASDIPSLPGRQVSSS